MKLSVTLATYNEEMHIHKCLNAIQDLADEIIIVDGKSTDRTVEIAQRFGAKIELRDNLPNFHINKQAANDMAQGEWILQLDADEVVTPELKEEIRKLINSSQEVINNWPINEFNKKLFMKQQHQLEMRDGEVGKKVGDVVAFFLPRMNIFLGHPMKHTGVYPDGVIRLFKNGKAHLPTKDVHEQYAVDGRVGWLNHDLEHNDSPSFDRYIKKNARYASQFALKISEKQVKRNWVSHVKYMFLMPMWIFLQLFFRHGGYKDGFPGMVFAMYSGLTWAQAYVKYWEHKELNKLSVQC